MFRSFAATAALLLSSVSAWAIFEEPRNVPVNRIIRNLEKQSKDNQRDDWAAYYLARAHYLAFSGYKKVRAERNEQWVYEVSPS